MKLISLTSFLLAPAAVLAAWGYTDDGKNYVIDTNANLVVKVSKTNGDMTSIKYRGVEYSGQAGKYSHVESGLGASTVTIRQIASPNVIKVNIKYGTLKHDLVFRYGNPNVYIFMNKVDTSVTVSRYIVRIPPNIFTNNVDTDTDWIPNNAAVIEAGDVNTVGKHTYSKHYSGYKYGRTIDYDYVGYTNNNVGMYLIRSNHEKASGGPFFRSLVRRGGSGGPDLYDIYHYNMGHTDVMRLGLQGPSVLHFTDSGAAPNGNLFARKANWDWFDGLGIDGWVPTSQRGAVAGVGLANMKNGQQYVIGMKNNAAQYWTTAGANGAWRIEKALPGTYTLNVYKNELEVHTSTVTIAAGSTATKNTITCADPQDAAVVWRIGEWDGSPKGFLNFEDTPMKPTYMHPSDGRLANWKTGNYIIGTSNANQFPGYMWKDVNSGYLVYFRLTDDQLTKSFKIRIGVTEGLAGGRPAINVNSWAAPLQSQKLQGDTRSLTVGTYRGNNQVYEYTVPASAWLKSAREYQILKIDVITGKTATGYLSGGVSFDALDMVAV
ncbi:Rhamnogalacturonase B, N-terminal-domain-containing protein [Boeremia exigua]|uniref:Rhamnogalacturonase B, N-terminal-domain-containing protein n=1 Tax=Boeremia exigua TaxID=749465 RepID=UPI001E8EEC7C|nr:Rhamnogalacturonase B, N-terminal-domain-containing protein [Boeremia exigua]KAH6637767.1 Rhamnogalacturonase B, N-terminal-domain-containing protein [Boeremia exigua]